MHQIRKHLKKDRQSYKKENSRIINLDTSRVKFLRQLFRVRDTKQILEIKMLININESSITKDIRSKNLGLKKEILEQ